MSDSFDDVRIDVDRLRDPAVRELVDAVATARRPSRVPKPVHVETCHRCGSSIPDGDPFVPLVRWSSHWRPNDPNVIGRQGGAWISGHEPAGAICVACVTTRSSL